jgi:hypothetical protein
MLKVILAPFAALAFVCSFALGLWQPPHSELGAALPSATAVFETSLQSRISSTDTAMSLTSIAVRGGGTLSGYQCFMIDEGRSDAEYVCGTVSGTTVSSLERGLDPLNGTSTNSSLQFAHRVGADVKITDFPLLERLTNQANGVEAFANALSYASGVTPTAASNLTDKKYVDGLAFSGAGVIDASSVAKGVVELATGAEAAASTANGGSGVLSLPASLATSTFNAATAANRLLVTGSGGTLDLKFLTGGIAPGASSTALMSNGSTGASWNLVNSNLPGNSAPVSSINSTASTSMYQISIPGGSLGASSTLITTLKGVQFSLSGGKCVFTEVGYGNSTTTLNSCSPNTVAGTVVYTGDFTFTMQANGTAAQRNAIQLLMASSTQAATSGGGGFILGGDYYGNAGATYATSSTAENSALTKNLTIIMRNSNAASSLQSSSFFGYTQILRQ